MTATGRKIEKNKILFGSKLIVCEWNKDRWGNFKKVIKGETYRIKFKKTVVRLEVLMGKSWIKVNSMYISKLTDNDMTMFAGRSV